MPEKAKYNADELVPPTFIDQQFVVDLVKSVEKDPELILTSHEIRPGSSAGDHYASVMFKIIVTYETKGRKVTDRRFILKTIPDSGEKKEFLSNFPVFVSEINMYSKTIPAMKEILAKHGEKGMWPNMVYSMDSPPVIVFDDLTQDNFGMVYKQLSLEDYTLIMDRIAKYHALSMVIAESDQKELVTEHHSAFKGEDLRPLFESMIRQADEFGEAVAEWPGMEQLGAKMKNRGETMFNNYALTYTQKNTWGFNVLNHGDFHIRNMMFQKDGKGSITDVTFLDFQIPMYFSPALDLIYGFNTIGGSEVRENKGKVLKMYHEYLVKYLKKFEYTGKIPSIIDIHVEMLNLIGFDTFQSICFSTVFKVDLEGIELGELFNSKGKSPITKALHVLYEKPEFRKEMSKILIDLDNLGAFD